MYCKPAAYAALLSKNASPTEEDIDTAMQGHICRCGTYPRIKRAIQKASETKASKE